MCNAPARGRGCGAPLTSPRLSCAHPAPQDSAEAGTKEEVAALLLQLLRQKAALLDECFGIAIDAGARAGWRLSCQALEHG